MSGWYGRPSNGVIFFFFLAFRSGKWALLQAGAFGKDVAQIPCCSTRAADMIGPIDHTSISYSHSLTSVAE